MSKKLYTVEEAKQKIRETSKLWDLNNKEKVKERGKRWREKNREKLNTYAKQYRESNLEEVKRRKREGTKIRKDKNPVFKLKESARCLINMSFKRGKSNIKKRLKTEVILGCSLEFFVSYIINKCPEGIGVKDFGRYGYQLDHIIPISSAQTEEEVIKLSHYTNFQPLWWRDNIVKSNKF